MKQFWIGFASVLFSFLFLPQIIAQETRPTGLKVDTNKIKSIPVGYVPDRAVVPPSVDLRRFCPVPGNQGKIPSCVGWAIVHAYMVKNNLTRSTPTPYLSASYIYNQLTADSDTCSATDLVDGLVILKDQGVCTAEEFPNSQYFCKQVPNRQQKKKAASFRIREFEQAFPYNADSALLVSKLQNWLFDKFPVIVGMQISEAFKNGDPTPPAKGKGDWHAVVVVGYQETGRDKGYFFIMNSYGPDWGENGYIRISFQDTADMIKFGFVIY